MFKRLPLLALAFALAVSLTALVTTLPAWASPQASAPTRLVLPLPPRSVGGANGYTFLATTTVYSEIVGGTVLGTGTGVDDNNYSIPVGFIFHYNNLPITTLGVNANGFVRMGFSSLSSCIYLPLAVSDGVDSTCNNVVVALGRNLQGNTGGELRYEVLGTAPNRMLVVQWKDFREAGATGDSYNFQIRFYETTNIIEFVYGPFTQNANNLLVQVGLRGASNADYKNLGALSGAINWNTPPLGTSNIDTMGLTASVFPPNGLVYRFLPPPPAPYYGTSTKVVTPTGAVLPGQRLTYTIFLTNSGPTTGTPLLTDFIPAGTTFVPGSDSYSLGAFVPINYAAPLASDPADAPQGFANLDLRQLYIAQDQNDFYIRFTIGADVSAPNDWGKYLLFIDTDGVTGSGGNAVGLSDDAWGRNIRILDPHRPEYTIRTWVDALPYGNDDTQVWQWNGSTWANLGPVGGATLLTGTTSEIEWKVSKNLLGSPSRIWVEVADTGGTTTDNAQDTLNFPINDWNATNWTATATLANSTLFNNAIVWQNALAPGQGLTATFAVTVNANLGNIVNSATITDALSEAPVVRSVTNTLILPAYAGSTKTFTPTHDHPGQVVTWVVGLSNSTGAPGTPNLFDPLPAGLSYVPGSATATTGTAPIFAGGAISWTGNIAAFGRVTVTFQTTLTALSGLITNTATLSDPLIAASVQKSASVAMQPPTGGPDAFGYTYKDSFAVGGPTFSWILTTPTTSRLNYGGATNNGSVPVTLTFPFQFYSNVYTQAFASTNGLINFGTANTNATNQAIPTLGGNADNYLGCYWDDLRIHTSNPLTEGVYFEAFGTAPNRYAVFWFYLEDANIAGGPYNPMRFQAILRENGSLTCQYLDTYHPAFYASGDGRAATIGLENSTGGIGTQYAFNKTPGPIDPGLAIDFYPPANPVYALTKAAQTPNVAGAFYNQPITYTLRLTNTGFITGTAVLTDLIPAGSTYIAGSAILTGPGTLNDVGLIAWNGSLAPLQTLTLTFRVTNTTPIGRITNTAVLSDAAISALVTATVNSPIVVPDLSTSSKNYSTALVLPGAQFVYTLTVRNTNALVPATTASVSDVLPAGVSYVPGSATLQGSGTLTDAGGIAWSGALAPLQAITITFQVTVTALDGLITNTAVFSDVQLTAPITRLAISTVMAPRFGTSYKALSSAAVAQGETFTYTLVISNTGLITSAATTLADVLPVGLVAHPTGAIASSGTLTVTPASVLWAGSVPAGQSVTLTLPVSATAVACCQPLTNTAVISDPRISAITTLVAPAVLAYGPYQVFYEPFDGSAATLPLGWASQMVAFGFSTPKWEQATSGTSPAASPYSGTAMVMFNSALASSGSSARLESPVFQLQANGRAALVFWMYHNPGAAADRVQVQVSPVLTPGFVDVGAAIPRFGAVAGWQRHAVDLSAYDGQQIRIGLLGTSALGGNIYVDDLRVQKCCETLAGVTFSFSPTAPIINETLNFTATTLTGTAPVFYVWSFGDGAQGMGSTMTHAYSNPGTYTVWLTATNACTQQAFTTTVTVAPPPTPPAVALTSSSPTALGNPTYFTGTLNAGTPPVQYTWDFGDGAIVSASLQVTHTYPAPGLYTAILTATNAGGEATATTLVDVGTVPAASFTSNSPITVPVNTIAFTNTSLNALSYLWQFGDGLTSTLTNPTHLYATPTITNTYPVTLTAVNTYGTHLVSGSVTLYNPPSQISLAPTSFTQTQPANLTTNALLTLTNSGLGLLNWSLGEQVNLAPTIVSPPAFSVRRVGGGPALPLDVVAALTAAPNLFPVAPRRVALPTNILYNNGPIVNQPGVGAGGADASVVQDLALGMSVLGANSAGIGGFRVTDQFTVPAGIGWYVQTVAFYAYQTGSTTTSPITALNYRIWQGQPGQPGSTVVFGDATTNRLLTTTWANIHRVTQTSLTNASRPVMLNTASAGVFLPAGTYWLDWQVDGALASGPWTPFITINGQATTGDAYQYQPNLSNWVPLTDTGSSTNQGLPFILSGITCAGDVPWLSASPTSGSTPSGQQSVVNLQFNSTALQPGQTYTATLCVLSNDPLRPALEIPITLTVQPTFGVALTPASAAQAANPGATVTYTLRVTNTGNYTDTFNLSLAGHTWPTNANPLVVGPLAAGMGASVQVQVTLPITATANATSVVSVTARSQGNTALSAVSTLTTTALSSQIYAVQLTPAALAQTGYVGRWVTYTLMLTNTGTGPDTFNLSLVGQLWPTAAIPTTTAVLAAGANTTVQIVVSLPLTVTHGQMDMTTLTATSNGNPNATAQAMAMTTALWYRVFLPFIKK